MQRTDESGRSYGEDPYVGAGYAYAYGNEYSGSTAPDTATLSRDPVQLAYPAGHTQAMGTYPHVTGMPRYAAGPYPDATAWDAPRSDVLTVPPLELDTPGLPVAGPDTPASASVRPVFVDSSGRRQRRVLRAARLLLIPAGGYVALLISAVLGGPTVSSPFVPQPDSAHPTTSRATAPDSSSGTGHSAGSATAGQKNSRPASRQTPGPTVPTARTAAATAPAATSGPTAAPTRTTSPTSTATPGSKGRALGSSHKPVK
ncbi:hypothetical protein ACIPSA_22720 [Streptomyces sp. NPDC086549]|uniref:hypothetical protein n=1 Tax=Streptomyces sp. NPDC086549 TaxID=3365752 RepID=UPI0038049FB2